MPEVTETQQKRADNLIWNAAGSYGFRPDFKAYDSIGLADIYWNTIIGASRKYYDYPQFEKLFETLDEECQNMFWSALEKVVYPKERKQRPVLEIIRQEYDSPLTLHEDMTTEQIVEKAKDFFRLYGMSGKPRKKHSLLGTKKAKTSNYHSFMQGSLWHSKDSSGNGRAYDDAQSDLATRLTAEELKAFIEAKYGKPLFNPRQSAELEKELCSGNHQNCHILFTRGERADITDVQNAFEALSRQREAAQVEENRRNFEMHAAENRMAINKLAANIQNSILMHMEPAPVKANTGRLNGSLVWRADKLNDTKVFLVNEHDNIGGICVDILLDASTSQTNRVETISSQAYIIAEALRKAGIPCRVLSFCSMTGYTVVRVFDKNRDIFEFVANGCNRDGLAIRAARKLMSTEQAEHKMLIVLSDVKPNDVIRIPSYEGAERVPYDKKAGLYDTAYEVRRARSDGISVICIFTGEDEDLKSATTVYGSDFVRIRSFSTLADTVGKLIKMQIKNL